MNNTETTMNNTETTMTTTPNAFDLRFLERFTPANWTETYPVACIFIVGESNLEEPDYFVGTMDDFMHRDKSKTFEQVLNERFSAITYFDYETPYGDRGPDDAPQVAELWIQFEDHHSESLFPVWLIARLRDACDNLENRAYNNELR